MPMSNHSASAFAPWRVPLAEHGFVFAPGSAVREQLGEVVDWDAFAASWQQLVVDPYMADHGRYRRRRHAVFRALPGGLIERQPHQAHYQTLEYNPLHGGVQRWFEPIADAIAAGSCMQRVLGATNVLFSALSPRVAQWHVEVHQFRIEASDSAAGKPTPEGVHRDGVDWVLVLMIQRSNIAAGTTTIHDLGGAQLGSFTLTAAFDAALVDDQRCFHGVTAVTPIDPTRPAFRDVLVVTFRAENSAPG
jgi:hypothetical protein